MQNKRNIIFLTLLYSRPLSRDSKYAEMENSNLFACVEQEVRDFLILKWIDGEKDHMAWEAQYLNYIDKLGYENFLAAMM